MWLEFVELVIQWNVQSTFTSLLSEAKISMMSIRIHLSWSRQSPTNGNKYFTFYSFLVVEHHDKLFRFHESEAWEIIIEKTMMMMHSSSLNPLVLFSVYYFKMCRWSLIHINYESTTTKQSEILSIKSPLRDHDNMEMSRENNKKSTWDTRIIVCFMVDFSGYKKQSSQRLHSN